MAEKTDFTILVVDDEALLREAIAFDFRRKGHNVLLASSGNEAFDIIKSRDVHVVLTDVRMPNGDGITLLKRLKQENVFQPVVILLTGYADISLEEAYDLGADAVFPKPFDRPSLHAAVERALLPPDLRFKRKEIRVEADLKVGLKFHPGGIETTAKLSNLGRGGCFLELPKDFPKTGVHAEIFIRVENDHKRQLIEGTGLVRWVRLKPAEPGFPAGCGIEFTELNESCRSQVVELINYLKTKAYIPAK
jgi:CheY-like chemotaxis protein